jgi:aryl-alcohol dehydrogenase-like predicted oxidoreductase
VEQVDDVAKQLGATPAQVALAWLLAQGDDIVASPELPKLRFRHLASTHGRD